MVRGGDYTLALSIPESDEQRKLFRSERRARKWKIYGTATAKRIGVRDTTDEERTMSLAQAGTFGKVIRDTYRKLGYETVEVPCGSPEQRARFILESLPEGGS